MVDKPRKKTIREISPIDVYRLLPRTNCGECGEANCMAFATRLVNGEYQIKACSPLLKEEHASSLAALNELLAPPVRAVTIGTGDHAVTIGGKYVLLRHEFTYHNPTAIAVDVTDEMGKDALTARIREIQDFSYSYIGRDLRLDAIALRCTSAEPSSFAAAAGTVASSSTLPLILCAYDPAVMKAALSLVGERHPLLYAATEQNWKEMADLALTSSCPLAVSAPGDPELLRSLAKTLMEYGIEDLVLDPGTTTGQGLAQTVSNFTLLRAEACRNGDPLSGFPLLGTPISVWTAPEISQDLLRWREACIASTLLCRYADLLIVHSMDGWVLLPQLIWRFNLYTDPRKPVAVEPGVREFGDPGRDSPVLITTNYALTYFTVESDIKAGNLACFLIVADTTGISVESAVAGRYFTAESIADALKTYQIQDLVDHRHLIIPGLAARLSGETEETTGWHVLVGPKDSSGLPAFIRDHWPPKPE
jgi:acetyl-CoA decarbonylase/synthase complex subunit gamma